MADVHVWTEHEIRALAEFGADHGWFYGLVHARSISEDCILLAEIYPGMGFTLVDRGDIDGSGVDWDDVLADLQVRTPESTQREG